MQSTVLSKSEQPVESGDTRIFPLEGILPEGDALVTHFSRKSVSYLTHDKEGRSHLKAHSIIGDLEIAMLIQLLENFPYHAPYERLYAAFYSGVSFTEEQVDEARDNLAGWLEDGEWAARTRQVRRSVSRVRRRMKPLGFGIRSVLETGYLLREVSPTPKDPRIEHFALKGILAADQVIALSPATQSLLLLGHGEVLLEEHFAPEEITLLFHLFGNYPHFCSHAELLACLRYDEPTDKQIASAHAYLQKMLAIGKYSTGTGPVRNLLSRVRLKLHHFSIDMFCIVETGYMLQYRPDYHRISRGKRKASGESSTGFEEKRRAE